MNYVAFLIPVCGRGLKIKKTKETHIHKHFLLKFVESLTKQDKKDTYFGIFIGADHDDPFFSDLQVREQLLVDMLTVLNKHGVKHQVEFDTFTDTKSHPVQCWNNLFHRAYEVKVDNNSYEYFYQIGDDVAIVTKGWVKPFIDKIEELREKHGTGIVGPWDKGYGNLLTQSFVSRDHMKIFDDYYPSEFPNIYCDNWIHDVYKEKYVYQFKNYFVKNLGGPCRYKMVDAQKILPVEVAKGMRKIRDFLQEHSLQHDDKQALQVFQRYEEISKTMTTAPAKPFWETATKIFQRVYHEGKDS